MKWGGQEMQLLGGRSGNSHLGHSAEASFTPIPTTPLTIKRRSGFLTSIITDLLLGLETSPPPCGL